MKRFILPLGLFVLMLVAVYWYTRPSENPDPNHTHADFAVYVSGQQINFAKEQYMSGSSTGSLLDADHQKHDLYFHLHDGNGHVMHRHKPGLTVGQFFKSIGFTMAADCFTEPGKKPVCNDSMKRWQLFVNGTERAFDPNFAFADDDKLLFTYGANQAELQRQMAAMTDDACLYSKICPWRGDPPTENCIADPKIPCME